MMPRKHLDLWWDTDHLLFGFGLALKRAEASLHFGPIHLSLCWNLNA